MESKQKEILNISMYFVIACLVVIFSPFLALTQGSGLEVASYFDKVVFYWALGLSSLIILWIVNVLRIVYPNSFFKYFFLHNPENTEFGNNVLIKNWKLFALLLSIVFFSLIGYFTLVENIALGDLPLTIQQVTETANFILALEPAVSGENSSIMLLCMFIFGVISFFVFKNKKLNLAENLTVTLIVSVFAWFLGVALHSYRYAGGEATLMAVGLFWAVAVGLSIFFRSIVPIFVIHYGNNAVLKLKELFGSDLTIFIWVGLIISLIVLLLFLYDMEKKKV